MSPPLFRSSEIRAILGLPGSDEDRAYGSVSTDSRKTEPGALFVALRGPRFDGSEFVGEAAAAGALGAVVPEDRPRPSADLEWFPVPDPLVALGALAAERRASSAARVVGVTGTSGKTTVKEMIAAALPDVRVHRTRGNLNNQIGLPLSILSAPTAAEV
ncbi:MAG: Mur ligase domain-containing protein, partial [Gemmatimonadota bacterium]